MTRQSVALTPNLERLVRRWQAQSIRALNKDVSFNDALNQILAWGIVEFTDIMEHPARDMKGNAVNLGLMRKYADVVNILLLQDADLGEKGRIIDASVEKWNAVSSGLFERLHYQLLRENEPFVPPLVSSQKPSQNAEPKNRIIAKGATKRRGPR